MGFFDDTDDDQKTEDATPRRREEARDKGQVPLSTELVAALGLLGWLMTLTLGGDALASELGALVATFVERVGSMAHEDLTPQSVAGLFGVMLNRIGWATLTLVAPMFVLTALAAYAQIGLGIASKAMELKPEKLNPIAGLSKFFSMRSLTRTAMSFAKLTAILVTVALVAWSQVERVVALQSQEFGPALAVIGTVALRCTTAGLAAILALGILDVFLQRRQHEKELRMTKQEVKEELRSSEGDPQVKARIRRLQREMAVRRMMSDVPRATVVVTNPTHYAVALAYDRDAAPDKRGAPKVVAKGVDQVAQRIKEVAREAGVTIYEDVPLARALHARCEIGDEVPLELYQAVAEVLAYVYGFKGGRLVATAGAS
ncbi:MAG: flagellar biosynthesis protein FlhB [Planctomycetes bacterium]|nr:flagellar biosynthesis protein FlhB [Planctomycetota bacterium]